MDVKKDFFISILNMILLVFTSLCILCHHYKIFECKVLLLFYMVGGSIVGR
ncbi:MAG: hypothetical protein QXE58_06125 [Candidatus Methanomethylicia archaeon]